MAGGIFNIISEGNDNILFGSPTKSYWNFTYEAHTNFGKQQFRVDHLGSPTIQMSDDSTFTFKIPRYAELLVDSYLSINLPHIWSPVLPPVKLADADPSDPESHDVYSPWSAYEFKWIENLGAQAIRNVQIFCGGQKLQEFSGQYLLASAERDYDYAQKQKFNDLIGHTSNMNDPGNSGRRENMYPTAFHTSNLVGPEPSIRGRTIYIPINAWFMLNSQMAFPLASTQNAELIITITLRPMRELFQIRDIHDYANNCPYVAPNFNDSYMQFHRFIQPPPDIVLNLNSYTDTRTDWRADIHLHCTYAFLSNEEKTYFSRNNQIYLFKQVRETPFYNTTGSNKLTTNSRGLVSSWMFYLQRSDVQKRNEWSNRSNWPYNRIVPYDLLPAPATIYDDTGTDILGPGENMNGNPSGIYITGLFREQNREEILSTLGVLIDGKYREDVMASSVYKYIEKYNRTSGSSPDGLYCYNFALDNTLSNMQPSGALNTDMFNKIELEFTTHLPPHDQSAQVLNICDPEDGALIGVNKSTWDIYEYNYDFTLMEERYNIIEFKSGLAGIRFAI